MEHSEASLKRKSRSACIRSVTPLSSHANGLLPGGLDAASSSDVYHASELDARVRTACLLRATARLRSPSSPPTQHARVRDRAYRAARHARHWVDSGRGYWYGESNGGCGGE